jgi:hypothetical protein
MAHPRTGENPLVPVRAVLARRGDANGKEELQLWCVENLFTVAMGEGRRAEATQGAGGANDSAGRLPAVRPTSPRPLRLLLRASL